MYAIVTKAYSDDKTIKHTKKDFLVGYKLTLSKNYGKSVPQLEKLRAVPSPLRDYVLYYLARSLQGQGKCAEAKDVFQDLVKDIPGSRWAPTAEAQIKLGAPDGECLVVEQPPLEKPPSDCETYGDQEAQADCYFNRRLYSKATALYEKLCEIPSIPCLIRLSQASARSQDFKVAIKTNETLQKLYPRSRVADEARRKVAFLYQDSGDFAAAIPALQELIATSKARDERRPYRERIAWCQYRLGHFKEAVQAFDEALEEAETPFSLYWKARVLDKMGHSKETRKLYRDVVSIYGETYYGLRAQEKLGEAESRDLVDPPRFHSGLNWFKSITAFEPSEDLDRIYELTEIGLVADAEIEARRVRLLKGLRLPGDPRRLIKDKDGSFTVSVRAAKDEVVDYPLPYADALFSEVEHSKPHLIDPYLVYAMMRQESRYRETIVSPVGAIGLLQIMPTTGLRLAQEDGWPEYQVKWLYDPETNIELGVQYLQKLWGLLDGHWYGVVASYNAGESVVAEWLKQRKGLSEEEFIEEIPYRETRDYVKRVYTYWAEYRETYGGD